MRNGNNGHAIAMPPIAPDAEKGVLSSLLISPREVFDMCARANVSRETFYIPAHGIVFAAVTDLVIEGQPADFITIARRIRDGNPDGLDKIGGPAFLNELFVYLPTAANARYYLDEMLEAAARRDIIALGRDISVAVESGEELPAIIDGLKRRVERLESFGHRPSTLPPWVDAFDLIAERPELPAELVAGCLHRASKLVLGGSSKSNKTWSLIDLAISVATGSDWWGMPTIKGRVLYLNLEIAAPFFSRRLDVVMQAKGVVVSNKDMTVWNLRGHCCDISVLADRILPAIKRGDFSLIILDPIYKCLGDRDENKAGEIASLLNQIERIAVQSNAAVAFGAHYSKGNQSAKESIDRIGGSGVFARDPDAILTLTKHEEDECFTCEPVLRNHAPVEPFVLRWEYPLMRLDSALDASKLKQQGGRVAAFTVHDLVTVLGDDELKAADFEKAVRDETGMSRGTFYSLLARAKREKTISKSAISEAYSVEHLAGKDTGFGSKSNKSK